MAAGGIIKRYYLFHILFLLNDIPLLPGTICNFGIISNNSKSTCRKSESSYAVSSEQYVKLCGYCKRRRYTAILAIVNRHDMTNTCRKLKMGVYL